VTADDAAQDCKAFRRDACEPYGDGFRGAKGQASGAIGARPDGLGKGDPHDLAFGGVLESSRYAMPGGPTMDGGHTAVKLDLFCADLFHEPDKQGGHGSQVRRSAPANGHP
jgi:hypothetical protein